MTRRTSNTSVTQSRLVRATPAIVSFLLNLFSATAAYTPMLAHVDPRVRTALETPQVAAVIDLHSQLAVAFVTLFTLLVTSLLALNRRDGNSFLTWFRVIVIVVTLLAFLWLYFAGGARQVPIDLYVPPPNVPVDSFHIPPLNSPITWIRAIAFVFSAIYAILELHLFPIQRSSRSGVQEVADQANPSSNQGDDDGEDNPEQ